MNNHLLKKYFLNPRSILRILNEKGVKYLHHSNTVLTSLTYISHNALLSRAYVEKKELPQTVQISDSEDKTYNVWNDIFLDGLDLHKRYNRDNHYGPVLFVLKLKLLEAQGVMGVLVTRNNPMYWRDKESWSDRYYESVEDFERDYLTGRKLDSRIMFTFRDMDASIKLTKYLDHIVLDKPYLLPPIIRNGRHVVDIVEKKLRDQMDNGSLGHIPIFIRHAGQKFVWCRCGVNYNFMAASNFAMFERKFRTNPEL